MPEYSLWNKLYLFQSMKTWFQLIQEEEMLQVNNLVQPAGFP